MRWGTRRTLASGALGSTCRDIAVAPSDANIVYAAGNAGGIKVYRSANAGTDWSDITGNLPNVSGGRIGHALLVDPIDLDRVLVGTERGVFETLDGGATWSAKGLSADVRDFVRDASDGAIYTVTLGDGVFRSQDGGVTWQTINFGLDYKKCLCIALDPVQRYLFVGTEGGGVWRLDLSAENATMPIWRRYQ